MFSYLRLLFYRSLRLRTKYLNSIHGELCYRHIQHATGGSDWGRVSIIEVKVFFDECVGLSVINISVIILFKQKEIKG